MVTYAQRHWVFRILGHFGSSANRLDQWSTGFRIGYEDMDVASLEGDRVAFLETVAAAIETFHSGPNSMAGNGTYVDELTLASIGTDGKYDPRAQVTTRRPYPSPVNGTASALHTWNSALVVSLRTDTPRGIGSNGRAYWPVTGATIDNNTGRVTAAKVETFAGGMLNMLNAINSAAQGLIVSAVGGLIVAGAQGQTGGPTNQLVRSLRVDERLDSIENRENQQPAVWHTKELS